MTTAVETLAADRPGVRLSVVMSVYNNADTLTMAIRSILDQSFEAFELIVVNDGSTDGSAALLDQFAAADPRVRVVHQENTGLTRALIAGCGLARGEYIARHDADDHSERDRLKLQLAALDREPTLVLVSCCSRAEGPDGELLFEHAGESDSRKATDQLLNHRKGPSAHGSVMFRREAYVRAGGYREAFYFGQDSDLWLRLAEVGGFRYLPDSLYSYRVSPDSISVTRRDVQRQFGLLGQRARLARIERGEDGQELDEARLLRDQFLAQRGRAVNRRAQAGGYYFVGASLLSQGQWRALYYFWRTVRLYPLHWRAWGRLLVAPAGLLIKRALRRTG